MLSEMGALIERNGGVPYPAPVMQEVHLGATPEVKELVDDICAGKVQVMVFQTGVGTKALFDSAASQGKESETLQALAGVTVIARSPKPAAVLRRNNVHIDHMPPEPFTSADLLTAIEELDLAGKEVAVQAYGAPNSHLTQAMEKRGANVREVTLYTWGLAEDVTPVLGLIDALESGRRHRIHQPSTDQQSFSNSLPGRQRRIGPEYHGQRAISCGLSWACLHQTND